MRAKDLIRLLQQMPPEATVWHLWDGEARTEIQHVWLSRGGDVITADCEMVCYSTETRPIDAPTSEEDGYWSTARTPPAPPPIQPYTPDSAAGQRLDSK